MNLRKRLLTYLVSKQMTDPNLTDITLVLDKSGSMFDLAKATISGVNEFVHEQQKAPGDCNFSLVQFDTTYEPGYSGPIGKFPDLDSSRYVPGGMTALWDAMGRSIVAAGERFKKLPEEKRPGKVIFVIYTDGFENFSHEYNQASLKALVERQRDVYKWDFIFLGANQDAVLTAKSFGIQNSMSVAATVGGTHAMYASTSSLITAKRAVFDAAEAAKLNYSTSDRKKQQEEGAKT